MPSNATFICPKHLKTAKAAHGAKCPICREEMVSLGKRFRVSKGHDKNTKCQWEKDKARVVLYPWNCGGPEWAKILKKVS